MDASGVVPREVSPAPEMVTAPASAEMPRHDSLRRRFIHAVPLVLILLLASVLRIRGIGHDSLWGDEALTVTLARMPIGDLVKYDTWYEQIPPVHHLIVHFWIKLFGLSEASVRMPSAIAGIAGVWMMYVLVARLMGRATGLAAALLLAISPIHLAYSQETRAYTLLVLFSLISCDLFVRLLRRPTQKLHAAYVLIGALLLYTHLYGIFTIAAQNAVYAWVLWRSRRDGWLRLRPGRWILDNVAIAALFSPWVPTVVQWVRMVAVGFWVKKVTFDDLSEAYWVYSGSIAVLLILVALVVIALWQWGRRRQRHDLGMLLLLALTITPVFVPVIISVLTHPSFAPRYGIVACAGFSGLAAVGVMALRPWPLRAAVLLALVVLAPLGNAAVIPRTNWRLAGEYLDRNMRPGDMAVIHIRAGSRLYRYYVHRPDVQFRAVDTPSIPVSLPIGKRHVWLIIYDEYYPAQTFVRRAPWHIERRFVLPPNVLIMELTDGSEATAATRP